MNTVELVLPSTHPSPQPKRQIDRFSRFYSAHGRTSLYFTTSDTFPKIAPSHAEIWTPSNSRFLGPFWVHGPNDITIGSAIFTQVTAEFYYTLQWVPLSPKIAPSNGEIWTSSDTIPWAHSIPQPKRHPDWFSRFCTHDRRVSL